MPNPETQTGTLSHLPPLAETHQQVDLGTTNAKRSRSTFFSDGHVEVSSMPWILNQRNIVDFPHKLGAFSIWQNEALNSNIYPLIEWLSEPCDVTVAAGMQRTPLTVLNRHNDEIIAVITNKPAFKLPLKSETQRKLTDAGVDLEKADDNYFWRKAAAVADYYQAIAPVLCAPEKFDQIYIEPTLVTLARKSRGLTQGELGITLDDAKGITNGSEDPDRVRAILTALGYQPDQFAVEEDRSRFIKTSRGNIIIAGDFQAANWFNNRIIEESKSGHSIINPEQDIVREFDSNAKDQYFGADPLIKRKFKKINGNCVYSVERMGAVVNPNIIFEMWAPELAKVTQDNNGWFQWVDDQLGEATLDKNPFIYIPISTGKHELGIMYEKIGNGYHYIDHLRLQPASKTTKIQVTAAIYCGLGCEVQFNYGNFESYLVSGGFVQGAQPNKMDLFMGGLSPQTKVDSYITPDSGVMGSLMAMITNQKRDIKVSQVAERKPLGYGGKHFEYFKQCWLPARDYIDLNFPKFS